MRVGTSGGLTPTPVVPAPRVPAQPVAVEETPRELPSSSPLASPPVQGNPPNDFEPAENHTEETKEAPVHTIDKGVRMRLDQEVDRIVTQITDANQEVIKQIPPEDLLKLLKKFRALEGLLFDREA